jgi:hypothetical protein
MRTITEYDSARYYESLGARNGESSEMPAPCVDTRDQIEYGPCDCPWEDHSRVDTDPPF